jgi:hypothetical protein
MDPARQYANPYAYVSWKPTVMLDPGGMIFGFSGVFSGLQSYIDDSVALHSYGALLNWRGAGGSGQGGFNGPGGGPGATPAGVSPALQAAIEGSIETQLQFVSQIAEAQGEGSQQTLANPIAASLADQGHRVEGPFDGISPSSGLTAANLANSTQASFGGNLGMTLAGAATATGTLVTGYYLSQAGLASFGHIGHDIAAQLAQRGATGGIFGAAVNTFVHVSHGTLLTGTGLMLVFGTGVAAGVYINDTYVAPGGGLTIGETFQIGATIVAQKFR